MRNKVSEIHIMTLSGSVVDTPNTQFNTKFKSVKLLNNSMTLCLAVKLSVL